MPESTTRKPAATRKRQPTAKERAAEAGARVPDDHQAAQAAQKAEAVGEPVTVTVDGITVTIDPDALDDYDLMEQLSRGLYFQACPVLFGAQWDAIRAELREESGKLRLTRVDEFVNDVFAAAGQGKS